MVMSRLCTRSCARPPSGRRGLAIGLLMLAFFGQTLLPSLHAQHKTGHGDANLSEQLSEQVSIAGNHSRDGDSQFCWLCQATSGSKRLSAGSATAHHALYRTATAATVAVSIAAGLIGLSAASPRGPPVTA